MNKKSNEYYIDIINRENSKIFGVDYKALSNAKRTIKRRTYNAYKSGLITLDEARSVIIWLRG